MSLICPPQPLTELVEFLQSLDQRAPLFELGRLLNDLEISRGDLESVIDFGDLTYRRNLICEGPWYELLCICWRSGQRSPIHNHAGSTCGLRIIDGVATETIFEPTPSGLIKATQSTDYTAGHVCCTEDQEIHQVSNLQGPGQDLITLHIYSPPLRSMEMFSLTDRTRQLYQPTNVPVCLVGDCI